MKKILTMLLSLSMCLGLCTKVYAIDNLILNGDFSTGVTEPWYINHKDDTAGKVDITSEGMEFTVEKANANPWELGINQQNLDLKDGVKYILSFEAKADSDESNTTRITIENQDPNWEKNLEEYIHLTNEFQSYTFEFTKNVGMKNQIAFSLGYSENVGRTFTYKNISLIEAPVQKIDDYLLDEQGDTKGTLSGTDNEISVEINKVNQSFWDLSLKKRNIQLEKKKRYELSFHIDSSQEGIISFDLESMQDYNKKTIKRSILKLNKGDNVFKFNFLQADNDKQNLVFFISSGDGNTDMTNAKLKWSQIEFKEIADFNDTYIVNGTFDDDLAGWKISNSNGTNLKAEVRDGKAILSFDQSQGNDFWDSKFVQDNVSVASGKYRVSFDIGSNVDNDTQLYFSVESTDLINGKATRYLCDENGQPITLQLTKTNEMKTYSFDFDILIEELIKTNEDLTIRFDLGKPYEGSLVGKELYLDNIKLDRVGDVEQSQVPETTVCFDMNDVITNDFKGFGVQWDPYQERSLTEDEWQRVTERVDYLNPSFVRCMIYATTYCKGLDETGKPIFDFNSKNMKPLIKELDYLEDRQIETVFGEWEAPGKLGGAFKGVTCDNPAWAEMIAGLMDYLINEKGYTCIKYFNLVNEANSDWSYCGDYDLWQKGIKNLHKEFKKIGIDDKVTIIGPDTVWDTQHEWLKNIENDPEMNKTIGLWDVHMYPSYEEVTSGYIEKFVGEQRRAVTGKDFYMTEIGMTTGKINGDNQKYIREFCYGTIMADAATQVLRGGLSGVAIWDLDDAMHNQDNGFPLSDIRSLKQWGFWNSIGGRVFNQPEEENIRPHFYIWSLMTHLFPRHCQIINSTATTHIDGLRTVGMKMPNGHITYMLVNDSRIDKKVTIKDNGNESSRKIMQYNYFENNRAVDDYGYPIVDKVWNNVNLNKGINVEVPGGGVVLLSTLNNHDYVQETDVQFNNNDELTNDVIVGSEFVLKDESGNIVDQWTTTKEKHKISGLKTNTSYILTQTKVPQGYVKADDVKVYIKNTVQLQQFTVSNKHIMGRVHITVKDKQTNEFITNVKYVLKDKNGKVLETLITDSKGKASTDLYEIAVFENGKIISPLEYILEGNDMQKHIIHFDCNDSPIVEKEMTILCAKATIDIDDSNTSTSKPNVKTNDQTSIIAITGLLVLSIGGIVLTRKKKKKFIH